ncbi:hypothetical protein [Agrococcus sp. ARC_14]|uniref:hypothetical protein n=1 Tax=Agrococcus sp. ARC_14 TaxID=2919927 RepID=UPI001F05651C|nr:hypothetical protein [Agrococcus sp. ARC_14]MCH1881508.1 hypothetical protein [Agrococcus sp. ARC_14]
MDIMLDLQRLTAARTSLKSATDGFKAASSFNNDLERAVAKPDDRDELRDKVGDFESDWNDRREDLTKVLDEIHTGIDKIITEWERWDTETATELSAREEG